MKVLVGKARKEMRHELHLADVAAKAAAAEEASKAATTEKPPATVGNGPPWSVRRNLGLRATVNSQPQAPAGPPASAEPASK